MRLSTILTAYFAANTLAISSPSQHQSRDVNDVIAVLGNVKVNLQSLANVVKTAGDDPTPLLTASNALIKSINDGVTRVNQLDPLTFLDSVILIRPVQEVTGLSQSLITNLGGIKGKIQRLGECDVVRIQIRFLTTASQSLTKAIVAKIPEDAREIADTLIGKLDTVLGKSSEEFSEKNCINFATTVTPPVSSQSTPLNFGLHHIYTVVGVMLAVAYSVL